MTTFNPTLRLNRMEIHAGGGIAFAADFHIGLNIIRGENSSGKSTLMDFIFYGLGGDLTSNQWREASLHCDSVILEVKINQYTITLARDVEEATSRPMRLYFGGLQKAKESEPSEWQTLPFRRGRKESFSEVLFRFLGYPEMHVEGQNSRLTMNQILRLLYSDQMSPVDRLFRPQPFYDNGIIRETVGNLLCGSFSKLYYESLIRRKSAMEELTEVQSKINFYHKTYSTESEPLTQDWLDAEKAKLDDELEKINKRIQEIESEIYELQFSDRLTLNAQYEAYSEVVELQEHINSLKSQITQKEFDASDSHQFINTIESKIESLGQSQAVVESLGYIRFDFCPACLASIQDSGVESACSLCKTPFDEENIRSRLAQILNDMYRQKKESEELQEQRYDQIEKLHKELAEVRAKWEQASRYLSYALRTPTSELRSELRSLNRHAGYAQRRLEEIARRRELVNEIGRLTQQRDTLQAEVNKLDDVISAEENRLDSRKRKAKTVVADYILKFLHKDLERQSTFKNASYIAFDFDGDRISVDDESFFSASSMVYLRNSFFAGLHLAAANFQEMMHPRFLLLDTVEDKGMEPERSKNFQRLLKTYSESAAAENQIIIATSMIAEDLNSSSYTVGPYFTHENRALDIGSF